MATSVPAPIAMPTSAWAKAGGVVHPVTHHRDLSARGLQLRHLGCLVRRPHTGESPIDVEFVGDGVGDRPSVAGDHDDLDPGGV